MEKILVRLKQSSAAHAALVIEEHFAQACHATVVLLHVLHRGQVEGGGTGIAWALSLNESHRQGKAL
jgi:hypothetical protein